MYSAKQTKFYFILIVFASNIVRYQDLIGEIERLGVEKVKAEYWSDKVKHT